MKRLINYSLCFVLFVAGCGWKSKDSSTSSNTDKGVDTISEADFTNNSTFKNEEIEKNETAKTINQKLVFNIPPASGPGTGVCFVDLHIEKMQLTAIETCGGHNEEGHTETTSKLFKVPFVENQKYKVSDLRESAGGGAIECEYFEFKGNKLYLYDENKKIINDWFCTFGNIENRQENMETCDCVFLPSEY
jgi:hypothetical protein